MAVYDTIDEHINLPTHWIQQMNLYVTTLKSVNPNRIHMDCNYW